MFIQGDLPKCPKCGCICVPIEGNPADLECVTCRTTRLLTPEEFASQFFQDTGERKSTNWTRLRDAVAARDTRGAK